MYSMHCDASTQWKRNVAQAEAHLTPFAMRTPPSPFSLYNPPPTRTPSTVSGAPIERYVSNFSVGKN